MFIHLRAHSHYSFLRGLAAPAGLVQAASKAGMPALGLADRQYLSAAVEFYQACQSAGVQPILGLETSIPLPQDIRRRLIESGQIQPGEKHGLARTCVLLAMDLQGWSNLSNLSSQLCRERENPNVEPALGWDELEHRSSGLICLTGGSGGWAAALLRNSYPELAERYLIRLHELFPQRLYIELQRMQSGDDELTVRLASIGKRLSLPQVVTHDIYYLSSDQARLQQVVSAMRLNTTLSQLHPEDYAPAGAYFTTQEEMERRFQDLPAALSATYEIAQRCNLELPVGQPHLPELLLDDVLDVNQLLRRKAEEGARRLYGQLTPDLIARLEHELSVIGESGYSVLFLIMQEIVDFARQRGIPISSRGSAASSLVAHCLGITSPDPISLNLYFERFLNPARATPPDIDTDICSRRRDEVIHFVYRRYGQDRVAMVGTINRFRRRSALREVAKAFGLPAKNISTLVDSLPYRGWGPEGWRDSGSEPFAELSQRFRSTLHQEIFRAASALLGSPRHLSLHPGGMVIAPGAVSDLVPTQMAAKGVIVTQFDHEAVEQMGLVKIDLLGIRGLTVLGDVAQAVCAEDPETCDSSSRVLEAIPHTDAQVSELLRSGGTIGCFQIESPGMRATLKEIQAQSQEDILAALALYRPGPLSGGLKGSFVRRHLGLEPVNHLHSRLEPLLADTYGVILYQEQVLRIAHELAGLSLADADLLRRAMSHFDPGKQMETLRAKFIAGSVERSQVPEETAAHIWELMAAFAGYGFPKAHAASYAEIAWQAAWCKAHHPGLFMAAVLANWGGYYGQRVYLTEVRRLGLTLRSPHINYARREFSLSWVNDAAVLFMGLDQVRELTRQTQARILRLRPFHSLEDFLVRVDPREIEARNLIQVGALEGMGTIPDLLRQLETGTWRRGQPPLFSFAELVGKRGDQQQEDWTLEQRVAAQEAILGAGLDAHPLELAADQIAKSQAVTTLEAISRLGQTVRVAGMRQTLRRSYSEHSNWFYWMTLEDLDGTLNVLIPADVHRRYRSVISSHKPFLVEGRVEWDQGSVEPDLRAEKIWQI